MATSREFGKSPKSFYKPGFIDTVSPEMMKMSVDRELGEISKSMYQVDENVATKSNSKYKGKWNPVSGKYPDHGYENSYWDVETLDDKPYDFDGQTWTTFQTLIYDKGLGQYFQVNDWASGEIKERISRLQVSTGTSTAAIQNLTRVMADADRALAEQITNLTSTVNNGDTVLTAKINDLNRTFSDNSSATATSIKTLTSQLKDLDLKIDAESSKINTATKNELDNLSASLGAKVTAVEGSVTNLSSEITKTNKTVTDLISTSSTDKTALSSRIDGVDARITTVGNNVGQVSIKADKIASDLSVTNSTLTTLTNTVATNRLELKSEIGNLTTSIGGVDSKVSKLSSDLSVTNNTVANLSGTTSSQITTLSSSIEGVRGLANGAQSTANNAQNATVTLTQQMSTTANRLGQVEGKWGVTIDAGGNISGIQLNNGTGGSEFRIRADRLSFTDATTNLKPFRIEGGKVHADNLVIRGTLYAQDIVGPLAAITPWYNGPVNLTNSATNLSVLPVSHAVPFERYLVFNCGLLCYEGPNSDSVMTMFIYKNDVISHQVQFRATSGKPVPVTGLVTIPANWTGTVRMSVAAWSGGGYYTGGQGFAIATRWQDL